MGVVIEPVCSHARLCYAAQCIEMHLGDYHYSQVEPLTSIAAEKINVASAADYKIEAGSPDGWRHERKYSASRAVVGGYVSGIPISAK